MTLALCCGAVLVGAGVWKRAELIRLFTVLTLFNKNSIVRNFSTMERAFHTARVSRGTGPVSPLPQGVPRALPPGAQDWITARCVTSLLVMHKGEIVHEAYFQSTNAEDRRISWSMAKSYLSALFGVILHEGHIRSLDDLVADYAPDLAHGAYKSARIRDVLAMSSGVQFDEDYLAFSSDVNKMGRLLALGGSMDGYVSRWTQTLQPPGESWTYVSLDTHVLGMVIRGATGRDIPELLSEKIIAPLGQEQDASYLTDGEGVAFVLGGLNLSTRDYARFAMMFARDGVWNDAQIVPKDWAQISTRPIARTDPGEIRYGYQWWIPPQADPGVFLGRGIYGQYLYVDQKRDVVIVSTAADRAFRDEGVLEQNLEMLHRIAAHMETQDGP